MTMPEVYGGLDSTHGELDASHARVLMTVERQFQEALVDINQDRSGVGEPELVIPDVDRRLLMGVERAEALAQITFSWDYPDIPGHSVLRGVSASIITVDIGESQNVLEVSAEASTDTYNPRGDIRQSKEFFKREVVGRIPLDAEQGVIRQFLKDATTKAFSWSVQDLTEERTIYPTRIG